MCLSVMRIKKHTNLFFVMFSLFASNKLAAGTYKAAPLNSRQRTMMTVIVVACKNAHIHFFVCVINDVCSFKVHDTIFFRHGTDRPHIHPRR